MPNRAWDRIAEGAGRLREYLKAADAERDDCGVCEGRDPLPPPPSHVRPPAPNPYFPHRTEEAALQ